VAAIAGSPVRDRSAPPKKLTCPAFRHILTKSPARVCPSGAAERRIPRQKRRREVDVAEYRIYLVNPAGRVAGRFDTVCSSDNEARFAAKNHLKSGEQAEVWTGDRCVGQVYGSLIGAGVALEAVADAAIRRSNIKAAARVSR
jgi:hypothetical protein